MPAINRRVYLFIFANSTFLTVMFLWYFAEGKARTIETHIVEREPPGAKLRKDVKPSKSA